MTDDLAHRINQMFRAIVAALHVYKSCYSTHGEDNPFMYKPEG